MVNFAKLNTRAGWLVFLVTAVIYCLCIEPTASFWDCGEYIACSYGLETGHPPGAPFFLLLGRFFSLFSFGNANLVAPLINIMSALASAFTILFLFWSITHLARKILLRTEADFASPKKWLVLAAGAVGALSYAFTDSFWFSAEEGEVYALSSLFTAIVFWAMLRWESVADEPHSDRWLVLIAYMIGLSIGVHLLNLLTIPALVFIWYFRKTPRITLLNFIRATVIAFALLGLVQDLIIPGIVKLAGVMELWFVNDLGFKFNSGIIVFFIALVIVIAGGLVFSYRYKFYWLNTSLLCFTVLLIGYSSFLVLVIRSQAGTPINEGNPSNPISLLSYLNREQYGDWPLVYGQYYNTPNDPKTPYVDGTPVYVKDESSGRYIISDARRSAIPKYDDRGCTFFPRMYSSGHGQAYASWADVHGKPTMFTDEKGEEYAVNIPTFGENMRFFVTYQVGWMYLRYFMWNFAGRQNDHLGYGGDEDGNILTGVWPFDDVRLGDQDLLPDAQRNNKGRNRYFFIPLLLGCIGFVWLLKNSRRDTLVITLLFLCTGMAIVFYLNQTPWQPRERDYAYVGSFYTFAIWLGLGVIGVFKLVAMLLKPANAMLVAAVFSMLSPVILFAQNLNDHDRSGRTAARDVAINFLESCEPNAILFTYADNDTFPLWYAQEVLGIRRDVRIVCLSLLRSDWYIDQAKRANYSSAPLPVSMTHWQYREGTRDYMNIFSETEDTLDLRYVVDRFTSEKEGDRFVSTYGDTLNYIAGRNVMLPVGKTPFVNAEDTIYWTLRGNYLLKDQIVVLDILAHNDWKRPVYFAINMPSSCYAGLDDYLQLEGLAYRFVPVKNPRENGNLLLRPQVDPDNAYRMVMERFRWGNLADPDVYCDETVERMFADPMRTTCAQVALALAEAGRSKQCIDVIRTCTDSLPASQYAPEHSWIGLVEAAYLAGDRALAQKLSRTAFTHFYTSVAWYKTMNRLPGSFAEKRDGLIALVNLADEANDVALANEYRTQLKNVGVNVPLETAAPAADTLKDSLPDIDSAK